MHDHKYYGMVFDFNGTLFFDANKHEMAWREISHRLRGRALDEREMRAYVHGRTNQDIFSYILSRKVCGRELKMLAAEKEETYRGLCLATPDKITLAPGAEELLDKLKERGIPMTIATSSEADNLNCYREWFGLERWFDWDKILYDDGTLKRGKPFPDIYQRAFAKLGLPAGVCLVAEDAPLGIQAASSAGAGGIVAVCSHDQPQFLARQKGVIQLINDFREMDLALFA